MPAAGVAVHGRGETARLGKLLTVGSMAACAVSAATSQCIHRPGELVLNEPRLV